MKLLLEEENKMFLEALMYTGIILILISIGVVVALGIVSLIKAFGIVTGVIAIVIFLFLIVLFSLWVQYN